MTLVDAPTIPVPIRLAHTSIVGNTCVVPCAYAADIRHASAANVPPSFALIPITHVPSVTFAYANASGEDEARCEGRTGPQSGCGPVCGMSWEILLSRPSHRHCRHRCERPLRMDRPVHRLGDRAGRSPGSRVYAFLVRPSQFPSGRVGP